MGPSSTTTFPSEAELVAGFRNSCSKTFAKLYDRYSAALFGSITRWVKDAEVAENLLQDVFVKAWNSRCLYDEEKGRLFTWLYNISRHVCIDYLRSKRYKQSKASLFDNDIFQTITARFCTAISPDVIGLHKMIGGLQEDEKKIINLIYFEGYTQLQTARVLNMPLGTVKTRVSKGIKKLRRIFEEDMQRGVQFSLN